jgi:hypothetical protein
MMHIFIDTVLQVFESDGNLHIIVGVANGEMDPAGKDIIDKNLHLTIPLVKALRIIPDIANALPGVAEPVNDGDDVVKTDSSNETEGFGLHFKI